MQLGRTLALSWILFEASMVRSRMAGPKGLPDKTGRRSLRVHRHESISRPIALRYQVENVEKASRDGSDTALPQGCTIGV